jgi:glycosyltransferase involved in cell wall biosynthesis
MTPKVSVVIPTYNRADKVRASIDSVLAQTFTDLEVIVVDDGSTDDTAMVLKETYGDSIRYCHQNNQGVSAARNRGIAESNGEWVAFLDSDDQWEKEKLTWQFQALDRFAPQCGACYTDVRFFNHSETRTMFQMAEENYRHEDAMGTNSEVLRLLVRPGGSGMVVCLSSFIVRRDLITKAGDFNTAILYTEDSDFLFRLGTVTGFCYVNLPLVAFDRAPVETRHVGVSADWDKIDCFLQGSQLRLEGLLRLAANQPTSIRDLLRRQLADTHSGWANYYLETGQSAKARAATSKAVALDPSLRVALKWFLIRISPSLALRTVRQRETKRASEFTV